MIITGNALFAQQLINSHTGKLHVGLLQIKRKLAKKNSKKIDTSSVKSLTRPVRAPEAAFSPVIFVITKYNYFNTVTVLKIPALRSFCETT